MKVAIITLPLGTNYGGIMQAYALQTVLERLGHNVSFLEQKLFPLHSQWEMPFVYMKRLYKKMIHKDYLLKIFQDPRLTIRKNTDEFIRNHIHLRKMEESQWTLDLAKEYEVFVVGSDQVWRPCYFPISIETAYLNFIRDANVVRLSYAASFGTDENEYTERQIQQCSALLKRFNAVSVREHTAVQICHQRFDVEATQVLDPTLLLDPTDYTLLFNSHNIPQHKGNLMTYILDSNCALEEIIAFVSNTMNLEPFQTNSNIVDDGRQKIEDLIQPPIEEWLKGFCDAEFIITDSFHACVFAILFRKSFIVYQNEQRGSSRFKSLLELFHLQSRMFVSLADFKNRYMELLAPIDYSVIEPILNRERVKSREFLINNLTR